MARRLTNQGGRRWLDSGSNAPLGLLQPKSRSSPLLTFGLLFFGAFILITYFRSGPSVSISNGGANRISLDGVSCTSEVIRALPALRKAYGESMQKVLHVGPDTCSIVSSILKEGQTEAWGVEPYDLEDADGSCKSLVRRGFVRVADIKFPLPYRPNSFNLVIISDALDYLTSKYLNKTLLSLAKVSADGVVIFSGYPGQQRTKVPEVSKFGRPAKLRSAAWWRRYFAQSGLEESDSAATKFEQAAGEIKYTSGCQVFHLSS